MCKAGIASMAYFYFDLTLGTPTTWHTIEQHPMEAFKVHLTNWHREPQILLFNPQATGAMSASQARLS
jgi:hypothetical protein